MYKIPSTLRGDIEYTESLIQKFKAGEIKAAQLKSNRVPMGIYEQRKNNHFMLRIRCTGGLITPAQLKRVAQIARKDYASHIHITTRQEIQIHNVDIVDATPSLLELAKVGLATQGGGGNTIRNMLVNDLGGISDKEVFDPYPDAIELTSRLIAEKDSFTMPRKLKIAFDINEEDANFSLVNDFGLQPKVVDGQRGFKAFLGGSVATNPHLGWKVFDFLPEKDLFRALKAAKNFFNKYGNRKNRHKARIRYIFYKYGEEETLRKYQEEFDALKGDPSLDFTASPLPTERKTPSFAPIIDESKEFLTWKRRYAREQKQKGLFYADIPFLHGNNTADVFEAVADFLSAFGSDVIRFTPRQGLQIRNIPEAYLPNAYQFFRGLGLHVDDPVIVSALTSCTGADTCRLGICLPKGAIKAIRRRLLDSHLDLDKIPDFQLNINGCTNSCAQNAWADLGFSGRIGRVGDDPYPAYTIWLRVNGHRELAKAQGFIAAKWVPAFVEDYLRDWIDSRGQYPDYDEYVKERGAQVVSDLLAKYKEVPSYQENPDFYYDYSADEKFSLASHGKAECSAGLFDIIELDQDTIAEDRKKLEQPGADKEKILHQIVFSESRMLLVTRGLDPRTDDDVYDGFLKEFIDTGIVPKRYKPLVEKCRKQQPLAADQQDIFDLADLLNNLYQNMDDSLQFNVGKQVEPSQTDAPDHGKDISGKPPVAHSSDVEPNVKKDFRGVACPMNFVKTKIALSPMRPGEILEILLDDGQPIQNVPGSVRNEGHTVLSTEKIGEYWKVLIKKKS